MVPIYKHYGSTKYDPALFRPIVNDPKFGVKPVHGCGLWGSPIDAKYGWAEWCKDNEFYTDLYRSDNCFTFTLKTMARVCDLYSLADLVQLPRRDYSDLGMRFPEWYLIDFEEAARRFDAIELHLSEERPVGADFDKSTLGLDLLIGNSLYYALYGWDCDSILVLNPGAVVPLLDKGV